MDEWSGQPFHSPTFSESSCPANICINAQNLGAACGIAYPAYDPSTHLIYYSDVYLNTQKAYSDGPSSQYCDVRWTYRHEIGHAFSEGHSALRADLMWTNSNNVEHVDEDAQSELRAVYGAIGGSGGEGGGCPPNPCGASALKVKFLRPAQSLSGTVSMQVGVPTGG